MRFRIAVLTALIVATAYVMDFCLGWMDRSSEYSYTGGLLVLALWFAVVIPAIWIKLYKK